jgi:CHASE2 domain-containing sensor protein/predicted Ser/Thr protein kinase
MALTEFQACRRQVALGVAVCLFAWALLAAAYLAGTFEPFDHRILDWKFRLRGERDASSLVAMVSIDDATIRAYGGWPLPRDQYALLLTALGEAGAKAVGVDLQLPEDINHDPRHNALLAYVSREQPNIVHAVSFLADPAAIDGLPRVRPESLEALCRHGRHGVTVGVPEALGATLPYDELAEQAVAIAHITVVTDRDGAVRRQPLLIRYGDRVYPSLALRMVGIGSGHGGPPNVRSAAGGAAIGWGAGADWIVPLDGEGATPIDFAGDRGAFSNALSMIEVLRAYQAGELGKLRDRIAGRYVLLGLDSRTEVTDDVGTTPFAATTPLVFLHANVVENLVRHRFLSRPAPILYLGTLAVLAIVLGWMFGALPLPIAAVAAGGAVAAVAVADFALLAAWAVDAPLLAALLLTPVGYAGAASTRFLFLESRARQREADIREGRSVEQQFLPEALIGQTLSRYRIEEKLGRGGMGVVYRARDPRLDRDVAIKVLPGRALADERARKRFRREALALSKLNHPHIAGILDFDTQDGTDFLVMEFVRGTPLTSRMKRGALPETEVVRVAGEIAEGLAEAHGRGVVHRDLKPENVMLADRGEVKVLDFGLALFAESSSDAMTRSQNLTEEGHMVGTLPYMAPEVLRGLKAEARSDLYSLGVLTFEMATGRRPFPDDEPHELLYTILNQAPPRPRIVNGRISPRLEEIILRLLAKDPERRFASAAELLQSLRAMGLASGTMELPRAKPAG